MIKLRSRISSILFIAALAVTPYFGMNASEPADQNLVVERGGGGHGGGGRHGGGGHGGGGRHGGGGHHGDWGHRGDWGHHGGNWGRHGNWDRNDFYGFGFWGWPYGYDYGYRNIQNCYYYQGADGNWYYTCSGY